MIIDLKKKGFICLSQNMDNVRFKTSWKYNINTIQSMEHVNRINESEPHEISRNYSTPRLVQWGQIKKKNQFNSITL